MVGIFTFICEDDALELDLRACNNRISTSTVFVPLSARTPISAHPPHLQLLLNNRPCTRTSPSAHGVKKNMLTYHKTVLSLSIISGEPVNRITHGISNPPALSECLYLLPTTVRPGLDTDCVDGILSSSQGYPISAQSLIRTIF